jgi:hypothetical protein
MMNIKRRAMMMRVRDVGAEAKKVWRRFRLLGMKR